MSRPLTTSERSYMRERYAAGVSRGAIARFLGRHQSVVWENTRDVTPPAGRSAREMVARHSLQLRAERLERLYRHCVRALDEVRP